MYICIYVYMYIYIYIHMYMLGPVVGYVNPEGQRQVPQAALQLPHLAFDVTEKAPRLPWEPLSRPRF